MSGDRLNPQDFSEPAGAAARVRFQTPDGLSDQAPPRDPFPRSAAASEDPARYGAPTPPPLNSGPAGPVPYLPYPPYPPYPPPRCSWLPPFMGCLGCSTLLGLFLLPFFIIAIVASVGTISDSVATRKILSGPKIVSSDVSKIAIIRVEGTIMSNTGFINDQIEDVMKDDSVRAIVLRIDSPGGSVSASDYYYNKLTRLRKKKSIPIVVSMGGVCASGGYYVAMSVGNEEKDVLFAEPTTWTGSIGVIISHYDLSQLAEKWGVREDSIKSHELKGMGSLARPLSDQEREILQSLVYDAFERFREVVYSGRSCFDQNHSALDPLATGQVFTTDYALQSGLVDKEGYLEEAVERAKTLAGTGDNVQIFTYKESDSLSALFSSAQSRMEQNTLDTLRTLATPHAYYLYNGEN
ncbi:MAG: signal peptide peptidase SppA [Planctomycetia bacterium]|nr:signal peptide peptidase SppA [Planctomycetia bacterium]